MYANAHVCVGGGLCGWTTANLVWAPRGLRSLPEFRGNARTTRGKSPSGRGSFRPRSPARYCRGGGPCPSTLPGTATCTWASVPGGTGDERSSEKKDRKIFVPSLFLSICSTGKITSCRDRRERNGSYNSVPDFISLIAPSAAAMVVVSWGVCGEAENFHGKADPDEAVIF